MRIIVSQLSSEDQSGFLSLYLDFYTERDFEH